MAAACLAGAPPETRKPLTDRTNGDITTHYSAAAPGELLEAIQKIVDRKIARSATLTLVSRKKLDVGNRRRVSGC